MRRRWTRSGVVAMTLIAMYLAPPDAAAAESLSGRWQYYGDGIADIQQTGTTVVMHLTWAQNTTDVPPHYRNLIFFEPYEWHYANVDRPNWTIETAWEGGKFLHDVVARRHEDWSGRQPVGTVVRLEGDVRPLVVKLSVKISPFVRIEERVASDSFNLRVTGMGGLDLTVTPEWPRDVENVVVVGSRHFGDVETGPRTGDFAFRVIVRYEVTLTEQE